MKVWMKKVVFKLDDLADRLLANFIDDPDSKIISDPAHSVMLSGVAVASSGPITGYRLEDRSGAAVSCSVEMGLGSPGMSARFPDAAGAGTARYWIKEIPASAVIAGVRLSAETAGGQTIPILTVEAVDLIGLLTGRDRTPTKRSTLQVLRDGGLPVGTVLDVGVQHGTQDLMAAFPDRKHLLFEPVAENYPIIRERYSAIEHEIVEAAVTNRNADGFLEVRSYNNGSPLFTSTAMGTGENIYTPMAVVEQRPIKQITLDTFLRDGRYPGPYLLKLDVDGNELSILEGANETLDKCSCIIIEASIYNIVDRAKVLIKKGFALWDFVDFGYYYNTLSHLDLVFLHPRMKSVPGLHPWRHLPRDTRRMQDFLH